MPAFDPATWRLRVFGAVAAKVEIDWATFVALPRIDVTRDFHCVTSWSRFDNRWGGVASGTVLGLATVDPKATHVMLHCDDDVSYETNLALADFLGDGNLFAIEHDGKPLAPDHGGPVRFVCHHLYAWKSAKWVRGVELMIGNRRGYWEQRGYHDHADPWLEERYSDPE